MTLTLQGTPATASNPVVIYQRCQRNATKAAEAHGHGVEDARAAENIYRVMLLPNN